MRLETQTIFPAVLKALLAWLLLGCLPVWSRTTFPVLQLAVKGWVLLVVAAAARGLLDLNMGLAALGIMIRFETYMCPAELLVLLTDHIELSILGEAGAARWRTCPAH